MSLQLTETSQRIQSKKVCRKHNKTNNQPRRKTGWMDGWMDENVVRHACQVKTKPRWLSHSAALVFGRQATFFFLLYDDNFVWVGSVQLIN
mmetsp:Transcript_26244/g.36792  ORF Transcript_26244/g.36792 Transcript_26244/m.36792 type:complete len:91 (+) Transcript_26244:86-358(+)